MATNDIAEPTALEAEAEANQRAEHAKASLLSRVEVLKHKITGAKHQLDPQAQIAKHPLPAVGIAFALGVIAGLMRATPAEPGKSTEFSFKNAAFAGLTAIGLRMVREVALGQLGHVARQWWTRADAPPPKS